MSQSLHPCPRVWNTGANPEVPRLSPAPFRPNLILIQGENRLRAVPVELYLTALATVDQKKLLLAQEEAPGSEE